MKLAPNRILTALLLFATPILISCRQSEPEVDGPAELTTSESEATATKSNSKGERSYKLTGVVESLDLETGEVAIAHEEIPGFMPAMTMPFSLAEEPVLEELQVGDTVEGILLVKPSGSQLTDVYITELAEPPAMTLDTSGDEPVLRPLRPVLKPGQEVPDFRVTTQDGEDLQLSDLRGQVVVLTFIYTRCPLPDYCPLMDKKFAELARRVALVPERSENVRLLSISFDPEHDTPEVLNQHAKVIGAKPPLWRFAVASHEQLAQVAEPLGLKYGSTGREIIHSLNTAIINPSGQLARLETGNAWEVGDLMTTITGLLRQETAP